LSPSFFFTRKEGKWETCLKEKLILGFYRTFTGGPVESGKFGGKWRVRRKRANKNGTKKKKTYHIDFRVILGGGELPTR